MSPTHRGSDGRGAFHRPPRSFPPAIAAEPIVIARPPSLARKGTGTFVQMVLPILGSLGIVAFAVIMPSKLFLIVAGVFVAIAVGSVIASFLSQRRSGKLSARAERRLYRNHLTQRERQLELVTVRQREVDERLYPDPSRLVGLVSHRRYLWERRPTDADFLAFRLGRAPVPLACPLRLELSDDPLTEYQPKLYGLARELQRRYRMVDDLSVVASLADASVITLTGERTWITTLAHSLIAQAAAFRAPADLRVMACFDPDSARDWAWLNGCRMCIRGEGTSMTRPGCTCPCCSHRAAPSSGGCWRSTSSLASSSCGGSSPRVRGRRRRSSTRPSCCSSWTTSTPAARWPSSR